VSIPRFAYKREGLLIKYSGESLPFVPTALGGKSCSGCIGLGIGFDYQVIHRVTSLISYGGAQLRLIDRVAFSQRYRSWLYSAETETGENWIVRADWIVYETPTP
jgi:hypothetical protein